MAVPQTALTGIGLSTGTFFLIAGVTVVGTIIYFKIKKKKNIVDLKDISSDEEKYENHKWIIQNAIENEDKDKLERLRQNNNIMKYNDLMDMINLALKK